MLSIPSLTAVPGAIAREHAQMHASPVDREQLEATRSQLEAEGRLSAATRDMLEKAKA